MITGTVRHVIYRSPESGYTVLKVRTDSPRSNDLTVVGITYDIHADDHFTARGEFVDHPKFGQQFKAYLIESSLPEQQGDLVKYLGSGLIKGIGPKLAEQIVNHFGEKCQDILLSTPERLIEVEGIGEQKAQNIASAFAQGGAIRAIAQFLIGHGISPHLAQRILERYGVKAVERLQADPYILARDLKGVGFRKADTIATQQLGIPLDSPMRAKAAILYALDEASRSDGHCYLTRSEVVAACHKLVADADISHDRINVLLDELAQQNRIVITASSSIYLKYLYDAETFASFFIAEKAHKSSEATSLFTSQLHETIALSGKQMGIAFNAEQIDAIELSLSNEITIITGGPGCGKTTLVRALVTILRTAGKKIILCAPTGRAANRLQSVTGHDASTIHRTLKFREGTFFHNREEPLDADAVIIDECSMVDIPLAANLFQAIPHHCRVILVGDKDQLPSVGPGRMFGDLVDNQEIPCARLHTIHRRDSDSSINLIAHSVNQGEIPDIPSPDGRMQHEAYFIERNDPVAIRNVVQSLLSHQLKEKFGFLPDDVLLLTPTNKGLLGTELMNQSLQAVLNPPSPQKSALEVGQNLYRTGDIVCQRKNNYTIDDAGVFNGDTGRIERIDTVKKSLSVRLWDQRLIEYAATDINQLSLAYCMTIHRAQGSEAPCVVLILHHSHQILLERQLVYTAITRAKKLLIIVGTRQGLKLGCERTRGIERNTNLHCGIRRESNL